MKILFFARFRQLLGKADIDLDVPDDVQTVKQLIDWLKLQGPEYEGVFANEGLVRVAVERVHTPLNGSITGAKEVAFFPPVTGG